MSLRKLALLALTLCAGAFLAAAPIGAPRAHALYGLSKRLCDASSLADPANLEKGVSGASAWCDASLSAPNASIVTAIPYTPYIYAISLDGVTTSDGPTTIKEDFPAEFSVDTIACHEGSAGVYSQTAVTGVSPALPLNAPVTGTSNLLEWTVSASAASSSNKIVCLVKGFFMNPYAAAVSPTIDGVNEATAWIGGQATNAADDYNVGIADKKPAITIKKSVLSPAGDVDISSAPGRVKYQIEISATDELYFGNFVDLVDSFALTPDSVPLAVAYVANSAACSATLGSDCFDTAQNPVLGADPIAVMDQSFVNHLTWKFAPGSLGHLQKNGVITLTFEVDVSTPCLDFIRTAAGNGLVNRAVMQEVGNPAALDPPSADNIVSIGVDTGAQLIDPAYCLEVNPTAPPGVIEVRKTQVNPAAGSPVDWSSGSATVSYVITVANVDPDPNGDPVLNINVSDLVQELPGTPPFTATAVSAACTPQPLCGPQPKLTGAQQLIGYYDYKTVWAHAVPSLAPGQSISYRVVLRYDQRNCISATDLKPPYIRNIGVARYTKDVILSDGTPAPDYPYSSGDHVDTEMARLQDCEFQTTKKVKSSTSQKNKIVFDTALGAFANSITYQIKFANTGATARNIGTLMDVVTLEQANYATALDYSYKFTCDDAQTGVTKYLPSGAGTGSISYSAKPPNGARIHFKPNTPLPTWTKFPANSSLTCTVTLAVMRPPENNPYCLSTVQPQLIDLALMDVSALYPAIVPWQPSPRGSNWDAAASRLPKCYDLLIQKTATPSYVAPGVATSVVYSVTVVDQQAPNSGFGGFSQAGGVWNGPVLTDAFKAGAQGSGVNVPSGASFNLTTDPCGATSPCIWKAPPGSQPAAVNIESLPNGYLQIDYEMSGVFSPDTLWNDLTLTMNGKVGEDWYPKKPETLSTYSTVNVTGALKVYKEIDHGADPVVIDQKIAFPITVSCTRSKTAKLPYKQYQSTKGASISAPALFEGVWVESECKVSEKPDPAALPDGCKWETPVVKYPYGNDYIRISDSSAPYALTVVNSYVCPPAVDISVHKAASDYSVDVGETVAFTVTTTNDGASAIASPVAVNVSDQVPAGFTPLFAQSNADWQCASGSPIVCTYTGGSLAPGASADPITIVAQANSAGAWQNCATVGVTGAAQSAGGGAKSCVTVIVSEPPDPCCEEDCLFELPFFGDHHICVTWSMICCILQLLLLFFILVVLVLILLSGVFRRRA